MPSNIEGTQPLQDPMAELERQLIHAYLAGSGHEFRGLIERDDPAAKRLLADACEYASSRMSEIEARLHYLRSLHGQE